MFLYIKVILSLIAMFPLGLFAKNKVLIVADAGYEPYSYEKEGKPSGLYYELLKVIFARMADFEIEIHTMPWKRALNELKINKAFAIYPPYERPIERPWIHYSDKILEEHISLFCRKDNPYAKKKKWPDDFKDILVAKNSGFIMGDNFEKAVKSGYIKTDEGALTSLQNLQKIKKKYADCYVNDELSIKIALFQNSLNEDLTENEKIVKVIDLVTEPTFLGYVKNKSLFPYEEKFIAQFNYQLKLLKTSGELEKIYNNFITNSLTKRK
ncbi:transporter substrate-binding domain-containing protein [Pigmentibacter sp. JX0631]|uniref:substrate-binding periplasmic protein n=1 Tax=Pigmentibacter sp. JX0631 TaxID=2976982 RepID=UPI002468DA23|nr:transporter substrate-binding domain-containing protein [Pigmentibacter sp. JX0631]WGL60048.1 transporter substrate-binding domain-containing protein [Pigmentibacter sp. JX0631]